MLLENNPYEYLSLFYDRIQGEEEGKLWLPNLNKSVEHLVRELKRPLNILDLGCGTGYFSHYLSKQGHYVVGIDNSIAMLNKASTTSRSTNTMRSSYFFEEKNLCLILGDLSNLSKISKELLKKDEFDLAICFLDTVNHLTKEELRRFFKEVSFYLKKGGYFLFDILSIKYIETQLADFQFADHFADLAFFWDIDWKERYNTLKHNFILYHHPKLSEKIQRHTFSLTEYYYSPQFIVDTLHDNNFRILTDTNILTESEILSDRLLFVAEKGEENKDGRK